MKCFILLLATTALVSAYPRPEDKIITAPEPGQEYVFVQSTGSGSRPISRKDKDINQSKPFETSHKIPSSLKFALNQNEEEENVKPVKGKIVKRDANPADRPAPAPAGAIKLDIQKLLKMYESDLKTSTTTTAKPKSTTKSGRRRGGNRRVKKEAKSEDIAVATSPSPVLTTAASVPRKIDDDVPLVAAGSEKQRSRIQVKKGPNGQDYEYEYVYYYYDDDDDAKDNAKVTNSHDGPARNQISRGDKTRGEKVAPEANEVVPSASRQRTRGRQLGEEETVNEERLPANTRFPPRSRNLNTTPLPEEETKATSRGRGRGRPTTEGAVPAGEVDNVSDETQGSRGRTRANVRRPTLELVDSASFNTHTNAAGAEPPSGGPSFPTELPAGPVRFLGATPNERTELPSEAEDEEIKAPVAAPAPVSESQEESEPNAPTDTEATTIMSPMDKVALDLYAVVQGTQKLSGEDSDVSSEDESTEVTNDATTIEAETEPIEITTPTTTTTTTTTTTPAPTTTTTTTTTTTEAPLGRGGKYRPRIGGRRTTHAASTTEASAPEPTKKGKFGRPGFNRSRLGSKTTPEPAVENEATKEDSKPVSHSRPTLSRSRFGGSRTRGRTTAAPAENNEDSASSSTSAPSNRPSLPRARPSFNLRPRGRTTPAPADSEAAGNEETHESSPADVSSTTTRSRRISGGGAVRPLRPGPRINLAGRGRGATSTTTTEAPAEDHVTGDEVPNGDEENAEKEADAQPPADSNPIKRLQNRNRLNVQHRPKAAASAQVHVRRSNPLIARRRPGQTTEAPSSEAPQDAPGTEESPEEKETEAPASSSTTEEPRGLNKLLAGRRRLAIRQPEAIAKTNSSTNTHSTTITTEATERFRPSTRGVRRTTQTTSTTEVSLHENFVKSESNSIAQLRPNFQRNRFGSRTTSSPVENEEETEITENETSTREPSTRPYRRRPSFRNRLTTMLPTDDTSEEAEENISQFQNEDETEITESEPSTREPPTRPYKRRPSFRNRSTTIMPIDSTFEDAEENVKHVQDEDETEITESDPSTRPYRRRPSFRARSTTMFPTDSTFEESEEKVMHVQNEDETESEPTTSEPSTRPYRRRPSFRNRWTTTLPTDSTFDKDEENIKYAQNEDETEITETVPTTREPSTRPRRRRPSFRTRSTTTLPNDSSFEEVEENVKHVQNEGITETEQSTRPFRRRPSFRNRITTILPTKSNSEETTENVEYFQNEEETERETSTREPSTRAYRKRPSFRNRSTTTRPTESTPDENEENLNTVEDISPEIHFRPRPRISFRQRNRGTEESMQSIDVVKRIEETQTEEVKKFLPARRRFSPFLHTRRSGEATDTTSEAPPSEAPQAMLESEEILVSEEVNDTIMSTTTRRSTLDRFLAGRRRFATRTE